MIILSKKKILYTIGIISMFIFTYMITAYNVSNTNNNNLNVETVQTVALPVDSKVIIIDAGHGVPDEGAESSTRYNRSRNQFKNCVKSTKFIRTIRSNSIIN